MAVEVIAKKWGNSIGVIIPKEEIETHEINENDKLLLEIVKKSDLKDVFGSLKTRMTGQEFKDMVRKGWG